MMTQSTLESYLRLSNEQDYRIHINFDKYPMELTIISNKDNTQMHYMLKANTLIPIYSGFKV